MILDKTITVLGNSVTTTKVVLGFLPDGSPVVLVEGRSSDSTGDVVGLTSTQGGIDPKVLVEFLAICKLALQVQNGLSNDTSPLTKVG